jgi:hypothetical protein
MLWTPKDSANLEEIDAQHRYFFVLLDEIETSTKVGASRSYFDMRSGTRPVCLRKTREIGD